MARLIYHWPDIMHIQLQDDLYIDIPVFKEIQQAALDFGDRKYKYVLEMGSFSNFPKEVREYAAGEEANRWTIADAIVVKSLSQRMLINFFLRIDRPPKPTRLFNEVDKAFEWLESIKDISDT